MKICLFFAERHSRCCFLAKRDKKGATNPQFDTTLWADFWQALQRTAVVVLLVFMDRGLQIALHWSFRDLHFDKVEWFATSASLSAFLIIEAKLLLDILKIFVPLPNFVRLTPPVVRAEMAAATAVAEVTDEPSSKS